MPQAQRINGHWHEEWNGLETFPRDGRIVEIIDAAGDVWLATWRNGMILIDADYIVEPTHWRAL